jgi:hypothetical protein
MAMRTEEAIRDVGNSLKELSVEDHYIHYHRARIAQEKGVLADSRFLIGGEGPNAIHDSTIRVDARFETNWKHRGIQKSLGKGALVSVRLFHLPAELTKDAIDAFYYDFDRTSKLHKEVGFVEIIERGGFITPITARDRGYVKPDVVVNGRVIATHGIMNYLNNGTIHELEESAEETDEYIGQARNLLEKKHYSDFEIVAETLRGSFARQRLSDS